MRSEFKGVVVVAAMLILATAIVSANPQNPSKLTEGTTSRATLNESAKSVNANAGNVTQVDINGTQITDNWQGYFGNVSGGIILADSNNASLYNWSIATVTGEVYASESNSPTWASVVCANQSTMNSSESGYGMGTNDRDGVNETFTGTSDVTVGTTTLSSCPSVTLNGGAGFTEAALYDVSTNLIFAAIISDDGAGFDGNNYDYEMIVGVNGAAATPYYFFVEIV